MNQNTLNSLQFISQVLSQDIIPELEALESTNPTVDFTSTNAKLDNITSILNGIDFTPDTNVIAEFTVTSPMTSIDFSSLDINAHGGSYEVELRLLNGTGFGVDIYCFVNGDTVSTNYYSQYSLSNGGSLSGSRLNNARMAQIAPNGSGLTTSSVMRNTNGNVVMQSTEQYNSGSNLILVLWSVSKVASVSNITQLTFTASVANSIGIGSKIIIRRKDK